MDSEEQERLPPHSTLPLELKERGARGLPHQAPQLRGPDLHSLPAEGGPSCSACRSRAGSIPRARAHKRSAAPLPLHHWEAQHFSVILSHKGGPWDGAGGCRSSEREDAEEGQMGGGIGDLKILDLGCP